jgi:hypothetical protein
MDKETVHIAGHLKNLLGAWVHCEQDAVWLDGRRNVDRLAVAARKVNQFHGPNPSLVRLPYQDALDPPKARADANLDSLVATGVSYEQHQHCQVVGLWSKRSG